MEANDIKDFMKSYNLKAKQLAAILDVDPSYISLLRNGTRPVTDSIRYKIEKFKAAKGITEHVVEEHEPVYTRRSARGARGRVPVRNKTHINQVMGLFTKALSDLEPATYDLFPVEGTSMVPTVCEGDELLCKLVTVDEIIDGRVYVLVLSKKDLLEYRPSGVWVKRVYHRKEVGKLTCKSDNKETTDPYFTFKADVSEVDEVWYIVKRLTGVLADPNRDLYERLDELESRIEMLEETMGE